MHQNSLHGVRRRKHGWRYCSAKQTQTTRFTSAGSVGTLRLSCANGQQHLRQYPQQKENRIQERVTKISQVCVGFLNHSDESQNNIGAVRPLDYGWLSRLRPASPVNEPVSCALEHPAASLKPDSAPGYLCSRETRRNTSLVCF